MLPRLRLRNDTISEEPSVRSQRRRDDNENNICGGREEDCPETLLSLGKAMTMNLKSAYLIVRCSVVIAQAPTFSSSQHAKVLKEVGARSQAKECL